MANEFKVRKGLIVDGNATATTFIGNLTGTASLATTALNAQNWNSSSIVTLIGTKQNIITSGSSFNITSSWATNATNATTASYYGGSVVSASNATTASYASYADDWKINQNLLLGHSYTREPNTTAPVMPSASYGIDSSGSLLLYGYIQQTASYHQVYDGYFRTLYGYVASGSHNVVDSSIGKVLSQSPSRILVNGRWIDRSIGGTDGFQIVMGCGKTKGTLWNWTSDGIRIEFSRWFSTEKVLVTSFTNDTGSTLYDGVTDAWTAPALGTVQSLDVRVNGPQMDIYVDNDLKKTLIHDSIRNNWGNVCYLELGSNGYPRWAAEIKDWGFYKSTTTTDTASYALVAQTLLGSIETASYATVAETLLGTVETASYLEISGISSNYVPKISSSHLQQSIIYDNGNNVAIASTVTYAGKLHVASGASPYISIQNASYDKNSNSLQSYLSFRDSAVFPCAFVGIGSTSHQSMSLHNSIGGLILAANGKAVINVSTSSVNVSTDITARGFTGSLAGSASYALQSNSASYAQSASYALTAKSASWAPNAGGYTTGTDTYLPKWSSGDFVDSIIYDFGDQITINGNTFLNGQLSSSGDTELTNAFASEMERFLKINIPGVGERWIGLYQDIS